MRKIISIEHVEFFKGKDGNKYSRTHAILDDGEEVQGFGKDYQIGDLVQVFLHKGVIKMAKGVDHE